MHDTDIRIDKWLWAVRVFKTRSLATEACKKGRIIIDDVQVKPSRNIKIGDIVNLKKPPVTFTYKVISLLSNRVSAKLVDNYMVNITPEEEMVKLKLNKDQFYTRPNGTGRPTKKERRLLDEIHDNLF